MRGGRIKMIVRNTMIALLNELTSPRIAQQLGSGYRCRFVFSNETEAVNFKDHLFFGMGIRKVRVEPIGSIRCYCVVVTWYEYEREYLSEKVERYLKEVYMIDTNVNRENTKFYAIVTDKDGAQKAYEITHSSLESSMEWGCSGCYTNYTLRFEQGDMKRYDNVFTDYVKNLAELEKLKAENEQLRNKLTAQDASKALEIENLKAEKEALEREGFELKAHLGYCERQLRSACEFLNGYGDIHIDIPKEIKNLDHFSSIVNYEIQGENRRRDFGRKVAEKVRELGNMRGAWRTPKTAQMMEEDNRIFEDAVESAMNPFYVSSNTIKADRISIPNPAFDATLLCNTLRLQLNDFYGMTAAKWNKPLPIFNVYDSIKDVKFANPATIVFWKDGTKTVVKAQGDEKYVPEVGLAMCICKKVMGNTRDYYRVFKHWMKKV